MSVTRITILLFLQIPTETDALVQWINKCINTLLEEHSIKQVICVELVPRWMQFEGTKQSILEKLRLIPWSGMIDWVFYSLSTLCQLFLRPKHILNSKNNSILVSEYEINNFFTDINATIYPIVGGRRDGLILFPIVFACKWM